MRDASRLFAICLLAALTACGGSSSDGGAGGETGNGNGPDDSVGAVSGTVVYRDGDSAAKGGGGRIFAMRAASKTSGESHLALIDACAADYVSLWSELVPDISDPAGTLNITRTATVEGAETNFIAVNIDKDGDKLADLNIQVSGITGFEFVDFLNLDTDCDGIADINIDDDGDGAPDRNIDENGDGVPDYDVGDAGATSVAGAEVTLIRSSTGEAYTTTTDENGEFAIDNLPVGSYWLEITNTTGDGAGKVWRRTYVIVSEGENDLGTHPLDTGPYLDVVAAGEEMRPFIGSRAMAGWTSTVPFTVGASASWDLYILDPNARPVTLRFTDYSVYGFWEDYGESAEIATTPVPGEVGLHKVTVTVTLHENHYLIDIGGHQRKLLPRFIAGRDIVKERPDCVGFMLDHCDPAKPVEFDWEDVETIDLDLRVFNDDGIGSFYAFMDGYMAVEMQNPSHAGDAPAIAPRIENVTVNVDGVNVPASIVDGVVDLGELTDASSVSISVTASGDEPYPVSHDWELPYTMDGTDTSASTISFTGAVLPRAYPGTLYENLLHFSASYADVPLTDPVGKASVSFTYDIAAGREPAGCEGLSVNGGDGSNEDDIYYVGETIMLKAIVSDPKGLPVEYAIRRDPDGIPLEDRYVTGYDEVEGLLYVPATESAAYTIRPEDNSDSFSFMIFCRNDDGFGKYDSESADSHITEYLNVSY